MEKRLMLRMYEAIRPLLFGIDSSFRIKLLDLIKDNLFDTTLATLIKSKYESGQQFTYDKFGTDFTRWCIKFGYIEYLERGQYMVTQEGYKLALKTLKEN